jgi:hypothetical protein
MLSASRIDPTIAFASRRSSGFATKPNIATWDINAGSAIDASW